MQFRFLATSALLLSLCGMTVSASAEKPLRIILVGDSTMAPGSGYGDALCQRFRVEVSCLNLAKGGRSSASYRAEGLWEKVQNILRDDMEYRSVVLIQFGHNDQPGKPGRSTDLATEFPANLQRYVEEVKNLRALPLLLTPLSRRSFHDGQLQNDLRPWAEAALTVAKQQHISAIDLNADSAAAIQAMGEAEADSLAMAPPPDKTMASLDNDTKKTEPAGKAKNAFDRTHLGNKGAQFFAAMVTQAFARTLPTFASYLNNESK